MSTLALQTDLTEVSAVLSISALVGRLIVVQYVREKPTSASPQNDLDVVTIWVFYL